MSDKSKIEWTDATWNPVTGCSKVSAGCQNCYGEREFPRTYPGRKFTDVRVHPERLDQPLRWKRPRKIFVDSMGDLFHETLKPADVYRIFMVMWGAHWHTFQILTKRPKRMLDLVGTWVNTDKLLMQEFAPDALPGGRGIPRLHKPLGNVWFGVSVEDQKTAEERFAYLRQTPNACPWFSYEPALGPLVLTAEKLRVLKWMVAGGESGPNARPSHPDWFRQVRDQCQAAGVPFFFKQWGEWGAVTSPHQVICTGPSLKNIYEWPDRIVSLRCGKKLAGRLLDGREWSEFPEAR
jgi:protein gp37